MHISVAPYPASELSREVAMLKISLLYADTVKLYSPIFSIFLGTSDAFRSSTYEEQLEFLIHIRPILGNTDVADLQIMLQDYQLVLNSEEQVREEFAKLKRTRREPSPALRGALQDRVQRRQAIEHVLDEHDSWSNIRENLEEIKLRMRFENFSKATRLGLLKIDEMNVDKFEALEFVLRAHNNLDLTNALDAPSRRFTEVLMQLLFTPSKTYPLLDTKIGELLRIQPEFEKVTVSKVQAQKAKHAGLASSLFEQLPTFNEVTLDEILGIRKELSSSLIVFRGAVAEYTELLESDVWNEDFDAEADKVYEEKVRPAVEAIRLKVEEQSALKSLARVSENSIPALAMGALATGEEFLTSAFQQLVALGFTAFNTVVEAKGRKRRWDNLEHEKIFFYYKMSERYKG